MGNCISEPLTGGDNLLATRNDYELVVRSSKELEHLLVGWHRVLLRHRVLLPHRSLQTAAAASACCALAVRGREELPHLRDVQKRQCQWQGGSLKLGCSSCCRQHCARGCADVCRGNDKLDLPPPHLCR